MFRVISFGAKASFCIGADSTAGLVVWCLSSSGRRRMITLHCFQTIFAALAGAMQPRGETFRISRLAIRELIRTISNTIHFRLGFVFGFGQKKTWNLRLVDLMKPANR